MSWFRRKGKYWYYVESNYGKETQHYIGDDEAVKARLLPKKKAKDLRTEQATRSKG